MDQILAPISGAAKICGTQKRGADQKLRMSRHCVSVGCEEGVLLYHTLTGMMVLLPKGEILEENREALFENWFLVPASYDEQKRADEVRQITKMLRPPVRNKTRFTILTTTDCNARCFYCYEMGIRRFPMTAETARDVAAYILRVSGGKPVSLWWFGGEPLYNRETIDIICEGLDAARLEYESMSTTNGYYLDAATALHARDAWHLRRVQITIDGTEAVYNRTKAYIDADENPYQRVMDNIRAALEAGIQINIRLNMDAQNAEDLRQLVEDIARRFSNHAGLKVYVALLQKFVGSIHAFESEQQTEACYHALRERLDALGLLRKSELPRALHINGCMADNMRSEVILPDGRVGRCQHYSESIITGHISDDARDPAVTRAWEERLKVEACAECALYPICRKLKMCEWNANGCSEISRRMGMTELKRQILDAYYKVREGGSILETEEELHTGGIG